MYTNLLIILKRAFYFSEITHNIIIFNVRYSLMTRNNFFLHEQDWFGIKITGIVFGSAGLLMLLW